MTIGVVGKYVGLQDAYKSLTEALVHGGLANRVKVHINWLDAELFEHPEADDRRRRSSRCHAILVPGGFGERGSEGKIACVHFARERKVPFFGICLGMQMACIEGGAEHRRASRTPASTEFGECRRAGRRPDHRMDERGRPADAARPMAISAARCGSAPMRRCSAGNSVVRSIYGADTISERHRHRYEVNVHYKERAGGGRADLLRHEPGRRAAGDRRAAGPSLVRRRAVPPGAEEQAVRPASACSRASSRRR